jgi:hypothetical protein
MSEFRRPMSTFDSGRRSSVAEGPLYVPLRHTRLELWAECGARPVFPAGTRHTFKHVRQVQRCRAKATVSWPDGRSRNGPRALGTAGRAPAHRFILAQGSIVVDRRARMRSFDRARRYLVVGQTPGAGMFQIRGEAGRQQVCSGSSRRSRVVGCRLRWRFPLVLAGNCNSCLGTTAGSGAATRAGLVRCARRPRRPPLRTHPGSSTSWSRHC